jgi:hypothetical protein
MVWTQYVDEIRRLTKFLSVCNCVNRTRRLRLVAALAVSWIAVCGSVIPGASAADKSADAKSSAAALVAEVRRSFTLHGLPIPPEIFRDMGDGDMADSGSIWVTVDVAAAIGSNLYFDTIKQNNGWISQKKEREKTDSKETAYKFLGSTDNGLVVAIAAYSGGGSGDFFTLHILDVAAARAFDDDGKIYQRINLTNIRNVALGDRWDGEARIAKNAVIVTKRGPGVGPDSKDRPTVTITAVRP